MTKPLYFWNGSSFELVGPTTPQSPFAYQTSAPTAPATGDIWIDSDGDVDTYNRQLTRYYFVASAGQTSVSGTDANGLTLAYVAGSEAVYVNGALQVRGVDYTATNGTSITGLSALALNDVVEVFAYTAFTVANAYTKTETDSVAAAAPGLRMVVPTSVSVGSGSGSANAAGYVTFSGASSVQLNGVFSSIYDNYKIIVRVDSTTASINNIYMRYGTNGTPNTTAIYNTRGYYMDSGGNPLSFTANNASLAYIATDPNLNTAGYSYSADIFNPFIAFETIASGRSGSFANLRDTSTISFFDGSTSFTDVIVFPSSGNFSGTIAVYGYKD